MLKNITIISEGVRLFGVVLVLCFLVIQCSPKTETNIDLKKNLNVNTTVIIDTTISEDFVEIDFNKLGVVNQLVYATDSNFLGVKVYPCARAFLRKKVYDALLIAIKMAKNKGYSLVIYDAYRPLSIQKKMYEMVQDEKFVASPKKGSKHNRGCAIDVGLADKNGSIDFGSDFDDFSEKSYENSNSISSQAIQNRKVLRNIMESAGFKPYKNEWWHFNYYIVDYPVSNFIWSCQK